MAEQDFFLTFGSDAAQFATQLNTDLGPVRGELQQLARDMIALDRAVEQRTGRQSFTGLVTGLQQANDLTEQLVGTLETMSGEFKGLAQEIRTQMQGAATAMNEAAQTFTRAMERAGQGAPASTQVREEVVQGARTQRGRGQRRAGPTRDDATALSTGVQSKIQQWVELDVQLEQERARLQGLMTTAGTRARPGKGTEAASVRRSIEEMRDNATKLWDEVATLTKDVQTQRDALIAQLRGQAAPQTTPTTAQPQQPRAPQPEAEPRQQQQRAQPPPRAAQAAPGPDITELERQLREEYASVEGKVTRIREGLARLTTEEQDLMARMRSGQVPEAEADTAGERYADVAGQIAVGKDRLETFLTQLRDIQERANQAKIDLSRAAAEQPRVQDPDVAPPPPQEAAAPKPPPTTTAAGAADDELQNLIQARRKTIMRYAAELEEAFQARRETQPGLGLYARLAEAEQAEPQGRAAQRLRNQVEHRETGIRLLFEDLTALQQEGGEALQRILAEQETVAEGGAARAPREPQADIREQVAQVRAEAAQVVPPAATTAAADATRDATHATQEEAEASRQSAEASRESAEQKRADAEATRASTEARQEQTGVQDTAATEQETRATQESAAASQEAAQAEQREAEAAQEAATSVDTAAEALRRLREGAQAIIELGEPQRLSEADIDVIRRNALGGGEIPRADANVRGRMAERELMVPDARAATQFLQDAASGNLGQFAVQAGEQGDWLQRMGGHLFSEPNVRRMLGVTGSMQPLPEGTRAARSTRGAGLTEEEWARVPDIEAQSAANAAKNQILQHQQVFTALQAAYQLLELDPGVSIEQIEQSARGAGPEARRAIRQISRAVSVLDEFATGASEADVAQHPELADPQRVAGAQARVAERTAMVQRAQERAAQRTSERQAETDIERSALGFLYGGQQMPGQPRGVTTRQFQDPFTRGARRGMFPSPTGQQRPPEWFPTGVREEGVIAPEKAQALGELQAREQDFINTVKKTAEVPSLQQVDEQLRTREERLREYQERVRLGNEMVERLTQELEEVRATLGGAEVSQEVTRGEEAEWRGGQLEEQLAERQQRVDEARQRLAALQQEVAPPEAREIARPIQPPEELIAGRSLRELREEATQLQVPRAEQAFERGIPTEDRKRRVAEAIARTRAAEAEARPQDVPERTEEIAQAQAELSRAEAELNALTNQGAEQFDNETIQKLRNRAELIERRIAEVDPTQVQPGRETAIADPQSPEALAAAMPDPSRSERFDLEQLREQVLLADSAVELSLERYAEAYQRVSELGKQPDLGQEQVDEINRLKREQDIRRQRIQTPVTPTGEPVRPMEAVPGALQGVLEADPQIQQLQGLLQTLRTGEELGINREFEELNQQLAEARQKLEELDRWQQGGEQPGRTRRTMEDVRDEEGRPVYGEAVSIRTRQPVKPGDMEEHERVAARLRVPRETPLAPLTSEEIQAKQADVRANITQLQGRLAEQEITVGQRRLKPPVSPEETATTAEGALRGRAFELLQQRFPQMDPSQFTQGAGVLPLEQFVSRFEQLVGAAEGRIGVPTEPPRPGQAGDPGFRFTAEQQQKNWRVIQQAEQVLAGTFEATEKTRPMREGRVRNDLLRITDDITGMTKEQVSRTKITPELVERAKEFTERGFGPTGELAAQLRTAQRAREVGDGAGFSECCARLEAAINNVTATLKAGLTVRGLKPAQEEPTTVGAGAEPPAPLPLPPAQLTAAEDPRTRDQLRQTARELEVPGASGMRKEQLGEAVRAAEHARAMAEYEQQLSDARQENAEATQRTSEATERLTAEQRKLAALSEMPQEAQDIWQRTQGGGGLEEAMQFARSLRQSGDYPAPSAISRAREMYDLGEEDVVRMRERMRQASAEDAEIARERARAASQGAAEEAGSREQVEEQLQRETGLVGELAQIYDRLTKETQEAVDAAREYNQMSVQERQTAGLTPEEGQRRNIEAIAMARRDLGSQLDPTTGRSALTGTEQNRAIRQMVGLGGKEFTEQSAQADMQGYADALKTSTRQQAPGVQRLLAEEMFGQKGFMGRMVASTGTFLIRNFSAGLVFGLTRQIRVLVQEALETESTFVRVSDALEATDRSAAGMRTNLMGISTDLGVALQDVYETAANLTGAFEDVADVELATRIVSNLEMISQGRLSAQEGYQAIASVGAAFELEGPEGLERVQDIATVIQNMMAVNVESTIEGVGAIAEQANEMNIELEQASVFVAAIAKGTNQAGASAAEQFGRILSGFETGRGRNVLLGAGVATPEMFAEGETGAIITDLLSKWDELGAAQQREIKTTLASGRQARAFNALLGKRAQILETVTAAENSHGAGAERVQAIMRELNAQIKVLGTNWTNFGAVLVRSGILNAFGVGLQVVNRTLQLVNTGLGTLNDLAEANPLTKALRDWGMGFAGLLVTINLVNAALDAMALRAATTAAHRGGLGPVGMIPGFGGRVRRVAAQRNITDVPGLVPAAAVPAAARPAPVPVAPALQHVVVPPPVSHAPRPPVAPRAPIPRGRAAWQATRATAGRTAALEALLLGGVMGGGRIRRGAAAVGGLPGRAVQYGAIGIDALSRGLKGLQGVLGGGRLARAVGGVSDLFGGMANGLTRLGMRLTSTVAGMGIATAALIALGAAAAAFKQYTEGRREDREAIRAAARRSMEEEEWEEFEREEQQGGVGGWIRRTLRMKPRGADDQTAEEREAEEERRAALTPAQRALEDRRQRRGGWRTGYGEIWTETVVPFLRPGAEGMGEEQEREWFEGMQARQQRAREIEYELTPERVEELEGKGFTKEDIDVLRGTRANRAANELASIIEEIDEQIQAVAESDLSDATKLEEIAVLEQERANLERIGQEREDAARGLLAIDQLTADQIGSVQSLMGTFESVSAATLKSFDPDMLQGMIADRAPEGSHWEDSLTAMATGQLTGLERQRELVEMQHGITRELWREAEKTEGSGTAEEIEAAWAAVEQSMVATDQRVQALLQAEIEGARSLAEWATRTGRFDEASAAFDDAIAALDKAIADEQEGSPEWAEKMNERAQLFRDQLGANQAERAAEFTIALSETDDAEQQARMRVENAQQELDDALALNRSVRGAFSPQEIADLRSALADAERAEADAAFSVARAMARSQAIRATDPTDRALVELNDAIAARDEYTGQDVVKRRELEDAVYQAQEQYSDMLEADRQATEQTRINRILDPVDRSLAELAEARMRLANVGWRSLQEREQAQQDVDDAEREHTMALRAENAAIRQTIINRTHDPLRRALLEQRAAWTELQEAIADGDRTLIEQAQQQYDTSTVATEDARLARRQARMALRAAQTRDPLRQNRLEIRQTRAALRQARQRQNLQQELELLAQLEGLQQQREDLLNDIAAANHQFAVAIAQSADDDVEVARLNLREAERLLAEAQAQGVGRAELRRLQSDVINARKAARDAELQDQIATIDFNLQMGIITQNEAIAALQAILAATDLTEKQRRELMLKIKGLQDDLRNTLTGSGFNIPSEIRLPTAYEVRRSLGMDELIQAGNQAYQDIATMQQAMGSVSDIATPTGVAAQNVNTTVNNEIVFNQTVTSENMVHAVAGEVVRRINDQTRAGVQSTQTTPKLVNL